MDEDQKWHPYYLGNPVYAILLMLFFEWGVAMHDLEVENIVKGKRTIADNKALHSGLMRKVRKQALKDYVLFPALTGPLFPLTFAGNATANLVRNIWAFNIIFCGHFPAGRRDVHRGGVRGRVARPLVLPPAARLGQHHRRQAVPHHDRQPVAPDRAPPVPGPAGAPLPGDRRPRSRRSASATGWTTTPGRCTSSCSAWRRRSAGWPCRAASRTHPSTATEQPQTAGRLIEAPGAP